MSSRILKTPFSVVTALALLALGAATLFLQRPLTADVPPGAGVLGATVVDAVTGEPLAGVEAEVEAQIEPGIPRDVLETDPTGYTSGRFPPGAYRVRFSLAGYEPAEAAIAVVTDERSLATVTLEPLAPVILDAGRDQLGLAPDSTATVRARVVARDGARVRRAVWEAVRTSPQVVRVELSGRESLEATVKLPPAEAYLKALRHRLGSEGRLLDRWGVLGVTPADLAAAGRTTLRIDVDTDGGLVSDEVSLYADLSAVAVKSSSLRNVAVGSPVLLHGPERDPGLYAWSLEPPDGSSAVMLDPTERTPYFVPDIPGAYGVGEGGEARFTVYAGTWRGVLYRVRNRAWPVWMDERGCSCHFEGPREAVFEEWADSGHAEIFARVLETSPRSSDFCFTCHTVGFDDADGNGGMGEGPAYAAFLNDLRFWDPTAQERRLHHEPGNWDALLFNHPEVAKYANVQCENCHGPTDSLAHETLSETGAAARISLSAQVCGVCHQAPATDTFRDWWAGKTHSNYALALVAEEGSRRDPGAGCRECHTARGALEGTLSTETPPLTREGKQHLSPAEAELLRADADGVHPITCPVCHDPHQNGSAFRWQEEKVPVRLRSGTRRSGDRSELCKTCHRLREEDLGPAALQRALAPHAPQTSFFEGRDAYFFESDSVGSHARLVEDGCIWCHMKRVPGPAHLGYPRGGARHGLEARESDCLTSGCHTRTDPRRVTMGMTANAEDLEWLKGEIEGAIRRELERAGGLQMLAGTESSGAAGRTKDALELELVVSEREIAVAAGEIVVPLKDVVLEGRPLPQTDRGRVLVGAAWNYFLAARDGSAGGHNPLFFKQVLEATVAALEELGDPK